MRFLLIFLIFFNFNLALGGTVRFCPDAVARFMKDPLSPFRRDIEWWSLNPKKRQKLLEKMAKNPGRIMTFLEQRFPGLKFDYILGDNYGRPYLPRELLMVAANGKASSKRFFKELAKLDSRTQTGIRDGIVRLALEQEKKGKKLVDTLGDFVEKVSRTMDEKNMSFEQAQKWVLGSENKLIGQVAEAQETKEFSERVTKQLRVALGQGKGEQGASEAAEYAAYLKKRFPDQLEHLTERQKTLINKLSDTWEKTTGNAIAGYKYYAKELIFTEPATIAGSKGSVEKFILGSRKSGGDQGLGTWWMRPYKIADITAATTASPLRQMTDDPKAFRRVYWPTTKNASGIPHLVGDAEYGGLRIADNIDSQGVVRATEAFAYDSKTKEWIPFLYKGGKLQKTVNGKNVKQFCAKCHTGSDGLLSPTPNIRGVTDTVEGLIKVGYTPAAARAAHNAR